MMTPARLVFFFFLTTLLAFDLVLPRVSVQQSTWLA